MRALTALLLVLAGASLCVPALAQTSAAPKSQAHKFDPKRDAAKDIADAVALAGKQNKRVLLDVGGEWCIWCKRLDEFFATNQEAAKILRERYIVVKVNFSPENANEKVLSKYPKIKGYPHLFVLDKSGKLIHSQDTGELETGDRHDPAKVIPFLKKWAG